MKDFITPKRSITDETEKMLNDQIGMEAQASAYYLSMASWCETMGYQNSANFLYNHSEEERQHMLRLFRYTNDAGGRALQPETTIIKHEFKSLREVFEIILEHEIKVTKSINNIADHCLNNKDFATFNFIQWFVAEQREEEMMSRRCLELFDIIGEEGIGLYTIDQEIGKLEETAHGGEEPAQ